MQPTMPLAPIAPADVVAYVLADIAIIILAARIVGTLFVKLKQPRIVGEIIAGILIGPTVLGGALGTPALPAATAGGVPIPGVEGTGLVNDLYPVQAFAFLSLLGQIALVFFMFLIGLELEKRYLRGKGVQMLTVALAVVVVPVGLGFLSAAVLSGDTWVPDGVSTGTFSLFLGAGISVTAFPVMARILQEKQLLATPMGSIAVGSAAIVTVLMFLVIAAASASAKGGGIVDTVGVKLLLVAGLAIALLLLLPRLFGSWVARSSPEAGIDGDLIGVMLFGALATGLATDRILGVGLVGGFLFGLAMPVKDGFAQAVIARLETIVVILLLPVFLAVSGLRTDLTIVNGTILAGAAFFVVMMVLGKWGAGFLAAKAVGMTAREAHTIGVLMNCRGLLILVVGLIGLQLGVITQATQLVFVLGAIVTTIMTGPLVTRFLPPDAAAGDEGTASAEDLELARLQGSGTAVLGA